MVAYPYRLGRDGHGAQLAVAHRGIGQVQGYIVVQSATGNTYGLWNGGRDRLGQGYLKLDDGHLTGKGKVERRGAFGVVLARGKEDVVGGGATLARYLAALVVQVVDDGIGLVVHIGVLRISVDRSGGLHVGVEVSLEVGLGLVRALILDKAQRTAVGSGPGHGVGIDAYLV